MNFSILPAHEALGSECASDVAGVAGEPPLGRAAVAMFYAETAWPNDFDEAALLQFLNGTICLWSPCPEL